MSIPLFSDNLLHLRQNAPEPDSGSVYLPIAFKSQFNCEVGDLVEMKSAHVEYSYKIAGFLEDVTQINMMNIGIKVIYMNQSDFDRLKNELEEFPEELFPMAVLHAYKSDTAAGMADRDFSSQIEKATGVRGFSDLPLSKTEYLNYSSQFTSIFIGILTVFSILLFFIAILVINFSIGSSLEEEYVNIGALKGIGYRSSVITKVYLAFFLSAMFLGLTLGFFLSIPFTSATPGMFLGAISLLLAGKVAYVPVLIVLAVLLAVTTLFILVKMRRVGKISPMRALSGGRPAVFFHTFGEIPLGKPFFSIRMALRQLLSSLKQYVSAMLVIAGFLFFVLTVSSIFTSLNPDRMMADFYGFDFDLGVEYSNKKDRESIEIEMNKISSSHDQYLINFMMATLEGDSTGLFIVESPDRFSKVLEGRAPKFENEIALTQLLAESESIAVGDTISITVNKKTADFLVSGFYQSINNGGYSMAILSAAENRLELESEDAHYQYLLDNRNDGKLVSDYLNKEHGAILKSENTQDIRESIGSMADSSNMLTAIVTAVAVIFILVSSYMVSSMVFLKERRDYGIYKSIGMRTSAMRAIFTIRFLVVAIVASGSGYVLYALLGNSFLSQVTRLMGISSFTSYMSAELILLPVVFLSFSFTLFSWFISRKIKLVEPRELIID